MTDFNIVLAGISRNFKKVFQKFGIDLGGECSWYSVDNLFRMQLDLCNSFDRSFYTGTYDPILLSLIKSWIKNGDSCIDVGAQKGYVTLHLSCLVGDAGKVTSFEPDPRSRQILKNTLAANKFSHVFPEEFALGNENKSGTFYLSSQLGWSSSYPNPLAKKTITSTVEVKIRKLDWLIENKVVNVDAGKLSFIKIDCEGAELFAISGMTELLKRSDAMLWIEINTSALRASNTSPVEVSTLLRENGFRIFLPAIQENVSKDQSVTLSECKDINMDEDQVIDVVALKLTPGNTRKLEEAKIQLLM